MEYAVTVPNYARSQGDLVLVRPRVFGSWLLGLDDKPRTYPVEIGPLRTQQDSFVIKLPQGYSVDDSPDPVTLDTPFASYSSKVENHDGEVRFTRKLVVNQLELKPEIYPKLLQFMGQIKADEANFFVLKKQPSPGS
jgi:hypothetical protein